jgi:NAD-dependent SIR2 family protein deacetylase
MSWAESEKLNEWIERAYENGRREEQERIIKLLEEMQGTSLATQTDEGNKTAWILENAIVLIKGEPTECECDPCGNETCTCQGKRCSFCKAQDV